MRRRKSRSKPSATRDVPQLPLEVLEIVMQQIEDRNDLCSASLVCRFWYSAALPSLFRTIDLSDKNDFYTFIELIRRWPEIAKRCVKEVKFQPGERKVARRLDELRAQCPPGEDPTTDILRGLPGRNYKQPPMISLPSMPSVVALTWSPGHSLKSRPVVVTKAVTKYLSMFPSLTSLTLAGLFADVEQVKRFISHCGSQLEVLDFSGLYVVHAFRSKSKVEYDLRKARKLIVHDTMSSVDWIVDQLLAGSPPSALREFSLTDDKTFTIKAISHIFDMSAHSLEHFELVPLGTPINTPLSQNLAALHSFTLGDIQLADDFDPFTTLHWIMSFICSMAELPTVEFITLSFYVEVPTDLAEIMDNRFFDWNDFFAKLSEKFPGLKMVTVTLGMEMQFGERIRNTLERVVWSIFPKNTKARIKLEWEDLNPSWALEDGGLNEEELFKDIESRLKD